MNFQNMYTFTYQKTLLHTLLLLVFKIVESLQCIKEVYSKLILKGKKCYCNYFFKYNCKAVNSLMICVYCSGIVTLISLARGLVHTNTG